MDKCFDPSQDALCAFPRGCFFAWLAYETIPLHAAGVGGSRRVLQLGLTVFDIIRGRVFLQSDDANAATFGDDGA